MNSAWESPCQAHVYVNRRLRWNFFETTLFASSFELPACTATVYGVQKPFITTTSTPDLILAQINDLRILAGGSDRASKKGCESLLKKRLKKFIQKHTKKGSQAGPLLHNFIWAQPLYRKKNRLGLSRLSLVRKMGAVTVLLAVNANRPLQRENKSARCCIKIITQMIKTNKGPSPQH